MYTIQYACVLYIYDMPIYVCNDSKNNNRIKWIFSIILCDTRKMMYTCFQKVEGSAKERPQLNSDRGWYVQLFALGICDLYLSVFVLFHCYFFQYVHLVVYLLGCTFCFLFLSFFCLLFVFFYFYILDRVTAFLLLYCTNPGYCVHAILYLYLCVCSVSVYA